MITRIAERHDTGLERDIEPHHNEQAKDTSRDVPVGIVPSVDDLSLADYSLARQYRSSGAPLTARRAQ